MLSGAKILILGTTPLGALLLNLADQSADVFVRSPKHILQGKRPLRKRTKLATRDDKATVINCLLHFHVHVAIMVLLGLLRDLWKTEWIGLSIVMITCRW